VNTLPIADFQLPICRAKSPSLNDRACYQPIANRQSPIGNL